MRGKVNGRAELTGESMVCALRYPSQSVVLGFVGDIGERESASRLRD
jgi:hypothetical protein